MDIEPVEMSAYAHQNTCNRMFIASLFIMAPKCKTCVLQIRIDEETGIVIQSNKAWLKSKKDWDSG